MQPCFLLLGEAGLSCEQVAFGRDVIVVKVSSNAPHGSCPRCGRSSSRVHSHYNRSLADLPVQGRQVRLCWRSRKFFCDAADCTQRVFTERLPAVAASYARTTCRLAEALRHVAFACGGEGGARLASKLGMGASPDALLRSIRRSSADEAPTPAVLGVDDWALRRGQRYGTILCDLERHRPIDLLPERSSEQLINWLALHRGVQIISRDRGDDYAKGAAIGAPEAIQVADRFHLIHNLHHALVRVADRHHTHVARAAKAAAAKIQSEAVEHVTAAVAPDPPPARLTRAEQVKQANRARRLQRYEQVIELHHEGMSLRAIARKLGMHRGTVRRFVRADCFPEQATRQLSRRADACVDELRRRWDAGCHNAARLTRELQAQGAAVSYYMVRRRVARWRSPQDGGSYARQKACIAADEDQAAVIDPGRVGVDER